MHFNDTPLDATDTPCGTNAPHESSATQARLDVYNFFKKNQQRATRIQAAHKILVVDPPFELYNVHHHHLVRFRGR
jgi:hypothetical protein